MSSLKETYAKIFVFCVIGGVGTSFAMDSPTPLIATAVTLVLLWFVTEHFERLE